MALFICTAQNVLVPLFYYIDLIKNVFLTSITKSSVQLIFKMLSSYKLLVKTSEVF